MKIDRRTALATLVGAFAPLAARAQNVPTLAPLLAATDWIGKKPVAADLAGHVVLVDVFTFDCINCKHVVPNLRALWDRHEAGLTIVGVHSPETAFERVRGNVVANLGRQGIAWPVAVDNDFAIWRSFGLEYWPTQLLFDRSGRLAKTIVGDSQDGLVDETLRRLLTA